MLVTFGTKRANTGFVQIFGSKILKDFDQPIFQNNNVFFQNSRLSNRWSIEVLKNAGTELFFMMRCYLRHGPENLVGYEELWVASFKWSPTANDPSLRSGIICDTVQFARTQSNKKRTNVSRTYLSSVLSSSSYSGRSLRSLGQALLKEKEHHKYNTH